MSRRTRNNGFVRRDALHQWTMRFGPNMTPMVDIVLVILIFFMATAAFLGEEWFLPAAIATHTELPKGSSLVEAFELPPLTIDVVLDVDDQGMTRASSIYLRAQREPIEHMVERLSALPRAEVTDSTQILIKPTSGVPYRDVVRISEACTVAGITNIGIAVTGEGP